MRRTITLAVILLGGWFCNVEAQVVVPRARWYAPAPLGRLGYSGGFSSTPAEGYMHGMSDLVRSQGQAAVSYSQARINNEQARSAYMDNQVKWTETYYERRKLWQADQDAKNAKSREERDRYLASRSGSPNPRLSSNQYDAVTGAVQWPATLRTDAFAPDRQQIEELLLTRKYTQGSAALASQLQAAIASMQRTLRAEINNLAPNDYIAARKFLDALASELAQPSS